MSDITYPAQESFATGSRGEVLALMVCPTWMWAGLYASPFARTPIAMSVSLRHAVQVNGRALRVGPDAYLLNARTLTSACRWLDRQGVTVRDTSTTAKRSRP